MERHGSWDSVLISIYRIDAHYLMRWNCYFSVSTQPLCKTWLIIREAPRTPSEELSLRHAPIWWQSNWGVPAVKLRCPRSQAEVPPQSIWGVSAVKLRCPRSQAEVSPQSSWGVPGVKLRFPRSQAEVSPQSSWGVPAVKLRCPHSQVKFPKQKVSENCQEGTCFFKFEELCLITAWGIHLFT